MVSPKSPPPVRAPRLAPLVLRPMVRVERITLFEREVRERLSRSALELLFAAAETLSEGQRSVRDGRDVFFGSTMLTVDLGKLTPALRDHCDARTAARLATRLEQDEGALARIRAIAAAEAERLLGAAPRKLDAEVRLRAQGAVVYVDVDVEALP